MRRPASAGSPVVVKIGSSSLAAADGSGLSPGAVDAVAAQVTALRTAGHQVVLVTSAAVAAGLPTLGLDARPKDLPALQATAAVGQVQLMEAYGSAFAAHDTIVGQVLLTRDVLAHREQYLHAREALARMLAMGVVPIVNENDTVVVDELRFGDNDRLAAIVTYLVAAGMLVILTDTEGLFTADPRFVTDAELLQAVRHTDAALDELRASGGAGSLGSGGVATKVAAARMAAFGGTPTVVAAAGVADAALRAVRGEDIGTWIEPRPVALTARKAWIAFGVGGSGTVTVDAGAARALVEGGRSLLPAGVVSSLGRFTAEAAVEVLDPSGALIAKGLVRMSNAQLAAVIGKHSSEAGGVLIHRDDLVVLTGG